MAKSKKKPLMTAPDIGAVVDTIVSVVDETIDELGNDEAERALAYVTGYIRANMAQPTDGKFSQTYVDRKIRDGFDHRQAIRTAKYVESIGIIRSITAHGLVFKVGFQPGMMAAVGARGAPEKRAEIFRRPTKGPYGRKVQKDITRRRPPFLGRAKGGGLTLVQLGKLLEYGSSRQSPRPHWRPLWVWFHAQRAPILKRKIPRKIKAGIRKNLRWKR